MSMLKEFKEFAMRGNVMDMAIGIILGGAFGKIVSSLVSDVIMPPVGVLLGGADFSSLKVTISEAAAATETSPAVEAVTLNYGMFINTVIDFVVIAASIFVAVKVMNRAMRKRAEAPPAPPVPPADVVLLTEIRDLLKAAN